MSDLIHKRCTDVDLSDKSDEYVLEQYRLLSIHTFNNISYNKNTEQIVTLLKNSILKRMERY